VLAILVPEVRGVALPYVLLLPLAAAGIALAFRERNRLLIWVVAAAGALALSPVVFFVTGRYRTPLAPLLCILAAAGIVELLARPRRWLSAGIAAAVLIVSAWPARLAVDAIDFESEMYFAVGGRRARLGDDAGAVAAWERALSKKPDYLEAGFNRALALERMGRMGDAAAGYAAVLRYHPDYLEAQVRRAFALLGAGDLTGAEAAFRAMAGDPRTASVGLQGLAQVALARGDIGTAEALLAQAEQRGGPTEETQELRRQIEQRRRSAP
jgi:tetratricopeptide (TPR) repeat protein